MSTSGIFTSNLRDPQYINPSFTGSVAKYMPRGNAPLSALLSYIPRGESLKEVFLRWQFKHFEHPMFMLTAAAPAGQKDGNGVLSIEVKAGFPVENDVYMATNTQEQVVITGVNGNNQVTVRRAQGGLPLALPQGTIFWRVGTAFEEASLRPASQHHSGFDWADNVTQIFRNGWARSGTMRAIITQAIINETGIKEALAGASKEEMMVNHTMDRETSIIWGRRAETFYKGQPLRKMSGLMELIERYAPENIVVTPNGKMSYNLFEDLIDPMFDQVTDPKEMNDRVLMGTSHITRMVTQMGRIYNDKVLETESSTHFGMNYKTFETARGKFKVIEHPLMNHMAKADPNLRGMAMVLDLSSIQTHFLGDRDGVYHDWSGTNPGQTSTESGTDAEGGSILSEMSLGTSAPKANGIIYNWCEVARDVYTDLARAPEACFSISKPWEQGGVAVGETITVNVTGAVANQNLSIMTPTGVQTMTINGSGAGSISYQIPNQVSWTYEFSLVADANTAQRQWNAVAATAARIRDRNSGVFPYNQTLVVPTIPDTLDACDTDGKGTAPSPIVC